MSGPLRSTEPSPPSRVRRLSGFLHRHPILVLAILTPGIPEYLLGSSTVNTLILPPIFLIFLAANVALYTTGALLIREAVIRWNKGWATVFALGAAYAIAEEGIGTATMFNPSSSAVSVLGTYGHFGGVNWVFAFGIVIYHVVVSIAVPLALLDIALPETRRRSLLDLRQIRLVFGIFLADVVVLTSALQLAQKFEIGAIRMAGCVLAIVGLIWLARALPRELGAPPSARPTGSNARMFFLGLAFFPGFLFMEFGSDALHLPPWVAIAGLAALTGLIAVGVRQGIGRAENDRHLLALVTGLLVPVGAFGALLNLPLDTILVVDALAGAGLWWLWRHRPEADPAVPPESALTFPVVA